MQQDKTKWKTDPQWKAINPEEKDNHSSQVMMKEQDTKEVKGQAGIATVTKKQEQNRLRDLRIVLMVEKEMMGVVQGVRTTGQGKEGKKTKVRMRKRGTMKKHFG